jgi:galactokinase
MGKEESVLSIETQIEQLKTRLARRTGHARDDVQVVYSPLRVCPLGAHVDHQDGLVTGMTLDRVILLAFVPRADDHVRIWSMNFAGTVEFDLHDVPPRSDGDWGNYVRGAVRALQQTYPLYAGIDALVEGRMPIGGLSSSAAVGVAYLLALEVANGLHLSPEENIQHDRYIENVYLGLKNGILDQSIILMSDRDHLTFLDCRSVEFLKYSTPADNGRFEVLVAYSGLAVSLACTDYNSRVSECQQAARMMLEWAGEPLPERPRLRMVSAEMYQELGHRLPSPLDRRARHFFSEVCRVREGVAAWQAGDLGEMGRLINESGASSVYNYESGCPQLITLYEIMHACPGVYGARFSGGGFRGSCIGLVDPAYREQIVATIDARYPVAHPEMAGQYSVHFCKLDGPARLWNGQ